MDYLTQNPNAMNNSNANQEKGERLYRWVKAEERRPTERGEYFVRHEFTFLKRKGTPKKIENGTDFWYDDLNKWGLSNSDEVKVKVIEWLEALSPAISTDGEKESEVSEYVLRVIDTDKWYWCKCEKCGWEDSSQYAGGGTALADTGDYTDPCCPICFSNDLDGDAVCNVGSYEGVQQIKIPISVFLAPYQMLQTKIIALEDKAIDGQFAQEEFLTPAITNREGEEILGIFNYDFKNGKETYTPITNGEGNEETYTKGDLRIMLEAGIGLGQDWIDGGELETKTADEVFDNTLKSILGKPNSLTIRVADGELHPKVKSFAVNMNRELEANSDKGNWEDWKDIEEMIAELEYHKAKLLLAMRNGEHERVREHLGDCGNILMFIGNAGNLYCSDLEPKFNYKQKQQ